MTVKTMNATILRKDIQLANDMTVWVVANNSLGSVQSQKYSFNTGAVVKPRPPVVTENVSHAFYLEILWDFVCLARFDMPDISCQAQYRRPDQVSWTEGEYVAQYRFLLEGTEPFTAYVFRVCCACPGSSYWSDWSDDYTALTAEAAPVGVVDVWSDSRETDQAVVWKELPLSQARGTVLAYEVAVEHGGGNRTVLNVTTAQAGGSNDTGACCRLPLPLLGVTAVTISAINSVGRTRPALLALPTTGDPMPGLLSVSVVMKRRAFAVSWDLPSPLAETIEEYVLQQEVAGLLVAQGFDWTRANTTQRSIILTGAFQNYTPYSLSLFAVSGGRSRRLGSVIGYTRQGVPPAVPEFQVSRLSSSDATLTWQHIPLNKRMGVIQRYRLRQRDGPEHTVDGNSTSLQVSSLQPGQVYQFWIAAQTEAGAGSENTLQFSTHYHTDDYTSTVLTTLALFGLGLLVVFLLCRHRRAVYSVLPAWCFDKVPDLANSKVFLQVSAVCQF
ncbi:interleukin-6 receptor subunit beta-like isoform X2 [Conger conger]|nr:interleukin-6 receptor subunit beta-like isoform X2 [Conger conger]